MKPQNWDKLTKDEKFNIAMNLFKSTRGLYIVGQALARAVEVMKKEKYPEESNIEDMEMLGEQIFRMGYAITISSRSGRVNTKKQNFKDVKKGDK